MADGDPVSRSAALLAVLVSSIVAVEAARACSCVLPQSLESELEKASAVFSGRVVAVRLEPAVAPELDLGDGVALERAIVTFEVDRRWKGAPGAEMVVQTLHTCCACGLRFELAESYLVVAFGADEVPHVSSCSSTRRLSDEPATRDLLRRVAEALQAPGADGTRDPSRDQPVVPDSAASRASDGETY